MAVVTHSCAQVLAQRLAYSHSRCSLLLLRRPPPPLGCWCLDREFMYKKNPGRLCSTTTFTCSSSSSSSEAERQMTSDAHRIIQAAIQAVDPRTAVRAHLQLTTAASLGRSRILTVRGNANDDDNSTAQQSLYCYDLSNYDRILLVGFGKASAAMACAVVETLLSLNCTDASVAVDDDDNDHDHNSHEEPFVLPPLEGMIICKESHVSMQERAFLQQHNVAVQEASHPVPDERSVTASQRLLDLVMSNNNSSSSSSKNNTLLLACISGGGSALFCSPRPPLTLQHLQDTNTALLQSGWRIQDMNVVRQCLELGKGGGLAQLATATGGTTIVSLILSDIIGDPLDLIASGPTVVTPQSQLKFTTAWHLVQQDNTLRAQLPLTVQNVLRQGYEQEQQQPQHQYQQHQQQHHQQHQHCLVGNNARAVQAAAQQAQALGYHPMVWTTQLQGEAATVAQVLVGLAQHVRHGPLPFNLVGAAHFPVALIAGGETTVTLPVAGSSLVVGKGGRNQELALAAALALQNLQLRQVVVASIGTDGNDGPTDAAGAIVDGGTIQRLLRVAAEKEHDKMDNDYSNMSAEQALRQHNAYPFLDRCDSEGVSPLVKTGPTGTNVADICVILVHERETHIAVPTFDGALA